ncbi:transcriptional regulator [Paucilactobacillus sp. N302-9]
MGELHRSDPRFRKVEQILRDYPRIDRAIELRELEIRHPTVPEDENVGGGMGNEFKEHFTDILINVESDPEIIRLRTQRDAVEFCLAQCEKSSLGLDTEKIIKEIYFKRYPDFSIDGLCATGLIKVGHSKAYELRRSFIQDVAQELRIF